MILTIDKNHEQIHEIHHYSEDDLYYFVMSEIRCKFVNSVFKNYIKSVKSIDIFNSKDQTLRKLKIFNCVHIAQIIDNEQNKFDIFLKRI
jgi:hypothetical protein